MSSIPSVSRSSAASLAATECRSPAARRARRFFALNLLLGASASVAAAVTVAGGVASIHAVPTASTSHIALLGLHLSLPHLNVAAGVLLALATLGLAALGGGLIAATGQVLASRRFQHRLDAHLPRRRDDFFVFDDPAAQAFCVGLLRPRIYVSSGALEVLSQAELDSVLAHERHHRERHDPLRIAVARVLARALFFMPAIGVLHRRYCVIAELAADDTAIALPAGSQALASALLAFSTGSEPMAAAAIAPQRVDHMLGRDPGLTLPATVAIAGLATSALLVAIAWQLTQLASVKASLSLPGLSARPCVMLLALVPSVLGVLAAIHARSDIHAAS